MEAAQNSEMVLERKRREFLTLTLDRAGIRSDSVLRALREVRREDFVPASYLQEAYADHPLEIGFGQTISQPSLVAYMTQCLEIEPSHRVLEIGTGSGYQTAILARLAREVYTVERIASLQTEARARLERALQTNAHFRVGDGAQGWPERAPYDRILVTAAAKSLPTSLMEQLAPGGLLLLPIGESQQDLFLFEKREQGARGRKLLPVRFVPLVEGPLDGPPEKVQGKYQ